MSPTLGSHLVVVPGHAVYLGGEPESDAAWTLLEFQRGEGRCYVEHIAHAVAVAAADASALVVFSGGRTRAAAGPRSEALGYWLVAERAEWWGQSAVRARATTEDYARDSFENLCFALCRAHERCGRFPAHISVVGWAFKRERFRLHAATLGLSIDYLEVNDPPELVGARVGEAATLAAFRADPLGHTEPLAAKRAARDPERRTIPYLAAFPDLAGALRGAHARWPWG